jgi:site-specific DNA-methyltransferase (adenine-specific)
MATPYYDCDGITIYHGDCREILPDIKADVLVTDPPYGMRLGKHSGAKDRRSRELRRGSYASYDDTPENYASVVVPAIRDALCMVARGAVFAPAPSAWLLPAPDVLGGVFIPAANGRSPWGFQNLAPVLLYGVAPDLHLGAKQTAVRGSGRSDVELGHPCPKPMQWLMWLVGLASKQGETIIDPFMGSGTTLRAAKDIGRKAIGIEIEESYCEIAVKRLAQGVLPL